MNDHTAAPVPTIGRRCLRTWSSIHSPLVPGGQRSRFGGAARSIARRGNARVGRSGLSRTDRSDPGVRASGPGLHPSALPLKDGVDEVERAKNRSKSTVRSKVEHVFAVMKLKFGFVKLRFRGLKKNATQLFAVCALVNLYLARKKLLLLAPA